MMQIILGIIVLLHGLVHLWYVILSQGWVKFQADMGWTGQSWLLTNVLGDNFIRVLATTFYSLSTFLFVMAGVGLLFSQGWTRIWMIAASVISAITIFVFWDGNFSMLVEKGLLGFLISAGLLVAALGFKWPAL
jgi:hypothetical protein